MNELVRVEQPNADVRAYRASTEAADMCKEIVVATSSNIQGKRYVAVEGWQALALSARMRRRGTADSHAGGPYPNATTTRSAQWPKLAQ
jgi:hypothetical protein